MVANKGIITYTELVGELTYSCYKFNRESFPNTTPEQWKAVFGDTTLMEQRYQKELKE